MTHSHPGLPGLFHTHTHDGHTHTHLNPAAARSGTEVRLHLRGVVLPEGE
ncbi:MAG: amidohydrolase, partial [Propionibacteriaceae bacterium]|nr:amidohydrolase [Propionibacteriaceae bacterium]